MKTRLLCVFLVLLVTASVSVADYFFSNGATSKSIDFIIRGPTGEPNAALTITNLDLYVTRVGHQRVKLGDMTALASAEAAWDDLKAFHVGGGHYRVDIPDANLADGVGVNLIYEVNDPSTTNNFDQAWAIVHLNAPVDANKVAGGTPIASTDNLNCYLTGIKTTALPAEAGAGQMAASFGKQYDVATSNFTNASVNSTSDPNKVAEDVWTYATRVLTAATNLSTLAQASALLADFTDLKHAFGDVNTALAAVSNPSVLSTTVATGGTASSFTLTAGKASAGAYEYCLIEVTDATDSHTEVRVCTSYTAGRVVTVNLPFSFVPAPGDVAEFKTGYVLAPKITRK